MIPGRYTLGDQLDYFFSFAVRGRKDDDEHNHANEEHVMCRLSE